MAKIWVGDGFGGKGAWPPPVKFCYQLCCVFQLDNKKVNGQASGTSGGESSKNRDPSKVGSGSSSTDGYHCELKHKKPKKVFTTIMM